MQKITREMLIEKASALIAEGKVDRVLGWKNGEFSYDVTPALFASAEEMQKDFVFGDFCGANFSKYLVKETKKDGKVLVFLKPCDAYSFNQLLTEHRFDREKVYAVGIPCDGMVDSNKVKAICPDAISSIEETENGLKATTIYGDVVEMDKKAVLFAKIQSVRQQSFFRVFQLRQNDCYLKLHLRRR